MRIVGFPLVVVATIGWALTAQAIEHIHPNIVVIMTDDQDDSRSLAVMPKTRNLLRRHGIHFTNSFVDFPACCPSRSSWLTGLSAHNHGVLGNNPGRDGGYEKFIPHESDTLAVWLRSAGYTTALMGKYMNGYHRNVMPPTHIPPGWDEWRAFRVPRYYEYEINENGRLAYYGRGEASYSTDMLARKARNFIRRQRRTKPFFLLVAPKAPHTSRQRGPAEPASRHRGLLAELTPPIYKEAFNEADVFDKPGFVQAVPTMDDEAIADATMRFRAARESLLAVDDMVETIVRALGEKKLLRRTVIIFTSDNGYLFGAHRLIGKGVVYEESIRVPLLIRGPGIPKGETRTQMVNNLDVVATIVALSGAELGYALDGKSLLPIISNPDAAWRTAMLVQGITPKRGRYVAVRAQTSVYVEHESTMFGSEQEYYDLLSDPEQLVNRAGDATYQPQVAALRALLAKLRICGGESCWATDGVEGPASNPRRVGRTTVYRGSLPKIYNSRREYDVQQSLDE